MWLGQWLGDSSSVTFTGWTNSPIYRVKLPFFFRVRRRIKAKTQLEISSRPYSTRAIIRPWPARLTQLPRATPKWGSTSTVTTEGRSSHALVDERQHSNTLVNLHRSLVSYCSDSLTPPTPDWTTLTLTLNLLVVSAGVFRSQHQRLDNLPGATTRTRQPDLWAPGRAGPLVKPGAAATGKLQLCR